MLDIKRIRQNPDEIEAAIRKRGAISNVGAILESDARRRQLATDIDILRSRQNTYSEKIPTLKGKDKEIALGELKELKAKIAALESDLKTVEEHLEFLIYALPNIPLDDVPIGKDERDNVVLREIGEKPKFDFRPKDYLTLAQNAGLIDVERAGKVSGSRFGYLMGDACLLEAALLQFGLKTLTDRGVIESIARNADLDVLYTPFIPVFPPVLIRPEMLGKMGYLTKNPKPKIQNPKMDEWVNEEVYFLRDDDLVLVGTSEQSIGPMHADEILPAERLPLRYLGFSSCFRREAGSYGKDTKGILRVHQFDKLEMFSYVRSEDSVKEHRFLLACEEYLMKQLGIPYRVVALSTGDLSAPSAATFDIESWMPGQNQGRGEYRETHSTSNTTDFQARRLNIRYRTQGIGNKWQLEFVHMLNGTAFAMGRMIIAIIENYQTREGKVIIPEALRHFMNKEIIG